MWSLIQRNRISRGLCIGAVAALSVLTSVSNARPPGNRPSAAEAYAARDQLFAAHKERDKAEKDFDDITAKVWKQIETDPTYTAATAELNAAQADYDALTQPALATLSHNPAYVQEWAAREKAHKALDAAKETGQATDEEKAALAGDVMVHNAAVHKMEADALKSLKGVAAAKAKMVAAQTRVNQLKARFSETVKQNPQWAAAKATMEESHKHVSVAEAEVARTWDRTLGPMPAQPRPAQPIVRDVQPAQPIAKDVVNAQPQVRDVQNAQPVAREPVAAQPVAREPVAAQPVNAQPQASGPINAQPVNRQPVNAQPIPAQPVPGNPPNN
jgi:hypothetical protein